MFAVEFLNQLITDSAEVMNFERANGRARVRSLAKRLNVEFVLVRGKLCRRQSQPLRCAVVDDNHKHKVGIAGLIHQLVNLALLKVLPWAQPDRLQSFFRFISNFKVFNNLGNLLFAQQQPE